MRAKLKSRRRGTAMVELTLCIPILIALLLGTWQYGYAYFLYNRTEEAVRSGVRYASARTYKEGDPGGAFSSAVKNMVVFADPAPGDDATAVVPGLRPENVNVAVTVDAKGVPKSVTVSIEGFNIGTFVPVMLNTKPRAEIPYVGTFEAVE